MHRQGPFAGYPFRTARKRALLLQERFIFQKIKRKAAAQLRPARSEREKRSFSTKQQGARFETHSVSNWKCSGSYSLAMQAVLPPLLQQFSYNPRYRRPAAREHAALRGSR